VNPRRRCSHHQQNWQANTCHRKNVRPHFFFWLLYFLLITAVGDNESARDASKTLRLYSSIREQELRFRRAGSVGTEPNLTSSSSWQCCEIEEHACRTMRMNLTLWPRVFIRILQRWQKKNEQTTDNRSALRHWNWSESRMTMTWLARRCELRRWYFS